MKKLACLLVALMMLVPFAAQGEQPHTVGDPTLTGSITFCSAYAESQGMRAMADAFNELYPNVEVNITTIGNNANGNLKIDTMLMAGNEIDVVLCYTSTLLYERARANLFYDITDLIAEEGIDMQDEWGGAIDVDGRIYSIPADGTSFYVAINMDMWEKAGLGEIPETWTLEEYGEICRKLAAANGVPGSAEPAGKTRWTDHIYQKYGANCMYNEDGTEVTFLSNPDFLYTLNTLIGLEKEGAFYPWCDMVAAGLQPAQLFLNGEVATAINSNLTRFIADTENYPIDFKVGFAPHPTLTAEDEHNYMSGPSLYGHLAISQNCENKEAAWAFVKFCAREGNKYLVNAGHLPTWRYTNRDEIIDLLFGSAEAAAELIDVEGCKRVAFDLDGDTFLDTIVNTEIDNYLASVSVEIFNYELAPEDGLAEITEYANGVLAK